MKIILNLLFSSLLSLIAGGVVVTPWIALMNYLAEDGPMFPAPLAALLVVLPILTILLAVQVGGLLYEQIIKRELGTTWIALGLTGGLGAGMLLYLILVAPYQGEILWPTLISLGITGSIMGLVAAGSQWILSRLELSLMKSPLPLKGGEQENE
jgi:hypothetical protein